jgi:hypothetical protein
MLSFSRKHLVAITAGFIRHRALFGESRFVSYILEGYSATLVLRHLEI